MKTLRIGTGTHTLPAQIFPDAEQLGSALASRIAREIKEASDSGQEYLLGCPAGRTGVSTFNALGRIAGEHSLDLSGTVIVMMDNYLEQCGKAFCHCSDSAHFSCRRFAFEEIRNVLNQALPGEKQLPKRNIWTPDPENPADIERQIQESGGIDLFILASGASDGHVAFNPPGSPIDSTCRIIEIAEATRRDNLGTFPEFETVEDVPTHGISVGLGTIVTHSKASVLAIHGEHKRNTVNRLHQCNGFDPDWPASCIFVCPRAEVFLDHAAAANIVEQ